MSQIYKVRKRGKLLPFLFEALDGWSKKAIKQRLQNSSVFVNTQSQTKHDFILDIGDSIQIGVVTSISRDLNSLQKLEVIYQDKYLIAINKPYGLLSVSSNKETKKHALALLRSQLSRGKESVKLWPVHRLDRETSGILLFATSKEVREGVMSNWDKTKKIYLAIVEGLPKEEKGTINQPLRLDDKEYRMHIGKHKDAKTAITHYEIIEQKERRTLLKVTIETGRQHQIRAHLSYIGTSVVGDERYGKKGGRMGLHSTSLHFIHPLNQKTIHLDLEAPRDFYALLN